MRARSYLVLLLSVLPATLLTGCGGSNAPNPNQPVFPNTIEFVVLPDMNGGASRLYDLSGSVVPTQAAAALTKADLATYGETLFGCFDPTVQIINPAFVFGSGRYGVTVKARGDSSLSCTIIDWLGTNRTVAVFSIPASGATVSQIEAGFQGQIAGPVAQALAQAILLVANNS